MSLFDLEHVRLVLVRGAPGSGKTSFAAGLSGFELVEADQFFLVDGVYRYDREGVPEAHRWAQERTAGILVSGGRVVVANTFTKLWELQPYFLMGVPTKVYRCLGSWPNEHGVPDEVVLRMKEGYQPHPTEVGVY